MMMMSLCTDSVGIKTITTNMEDSADRGSPECNWSGNRSADHDAAARLLRDVPQKTLMTV